jgi:hypothetical protein
VLFHIIRFFYLEIIRKNYGTGYFGRILTYNFVRLTDLEIADTQIVLKVNGKIVKCLVLFVATLIVLIIYRTSLVVATIVRHKCMK